METKNISGKIPVALHQRMWEELERTGMKVSDFLEKAIEEHFINQEEEMRRQVNTEAPRTLAITVPDSFFKRYQRCLEIEKGKHEGRYTNKEFLTDIIQKKMEEIELEAGILQDDQIEQAEDEPESMVEEERGAVESPNESEEREELEMGVGEEMEAEVCGNIKLEEAGSEEEVIVEEPEEVYMVGTMA